MSDLRKPHERRSDQLSVLVRRPLSAALVSRFARTHEGMGNSPQSFRFDDFDSDTETDGPPSELPNHARVRRSSSASALSAVSFQCDSPQQSVDTPRVHMSFPPNPLSRSQSPQASSPVMCTMDTRSLSPAPTAKPFTRRPTPIAIAPRPPLQARPGRPEEADEEPHFARSRARSFYGAAADVDAQGDSESDEEENTRGSGNNSARRLVNNTTNPPTISESRLRRALDEDYELFARRRRRPAKQRSPSPDAQSAASSSSSTERNRSPNRRGKRTSQGRATTSPSLFRRNTAGAVYGPDSSGRMNNDVRNTSRNILRRLASASCASRHKKRRSRSNHTADVDGADDTLRERTTEADALIADSHAVAVAPGKRVPLFVEEAGHNPRVAFVNGELRRVKVRRPSHDGAGPKPASRSMRFGMGSRGGKCRFASSERNQKKGFAFGLVRKLQEYDRRLGADRKRRRTQARAKQHKEAKFHSDGLGGTTTTESYTSGVKRERPRFFALWTR